jgi:hypothetical protein
MVTNAKSQRFFDCLAVVRTAAVVGTAAVVAHGVHRRSDRRDDRGDDRRHRRRPIGPAEPHRAWPDRTTQVEAIGSATTMECESTSLGPN